MASQSHSYKAAFILAVEVWYVTNLRGNKTEAYIKRDWAEF